MAKYTRNDFFFKSLYFPEKWFVCLFYNRVAASGSPHQAVLHNPDLLEAFDKTDTEPSDEEVMKQMKGFCKNYGISY